MASEVLVLDSPLPAEVAFDRLIDLTRVPEWDRGITGSRLVEGDPGADGAQYEVSLTGFDGQPTSAIYELTSVDEFAFTMVGTHADFRADDTVTVASTDTGCQVTYDAGLTLLADEPPLTEEQLAATFTKLVAVVAAGLTSFLAQPA